MLHDSSFSIEVNLFHPEEMAARYYYEKNLSEIFLFHSLDSNGGGFIFQ